jgi:hypothetical protein
MRQETGGKGEKEGKEVELSYPECKKEGQNPARMDCVLLVEEWD